MAVKIKTKRHKDIVFIGAGGTGGYIIPHVVRMCSHLIGYRPGITIIDPDIVEVKNCNRQNFILSDVGKPKAQVLAERYSAAFGYAVNYIVEKADRALLMNICSPETLIIDSIDNIRGRLNISDFCNNYVKSDWISIGNTESTGQLVFASTFLKRNGNQDIVDCFPETFNEAEAVKQEELEARRSCADNAVSAPQSLAINLFGASLAVNLLYEILYESTASYHVILFDRKGFIKYYDCETKFETKTLDNIEAEKVANRLNALLNEW